MAEPGRLMGQAGSNIDPDDIDADGEYEEDYIGYEQATAEHTQDDAGRSTDAEGSDVDAEGEEIDDDDSEPVGAVKIAMPEHGLSDDDGEHDGDAAGDSFSDAKTSDSDADLSSESEAENQWQADEEEPEAEKNDPNVCVQVLSAIDAKHDADNFADTATAMKTTIRARTLRRFCRARFVVTWVREPV
jgi:histone acetyltransferase SAS3